MGRTGMGIGFIFGGKDNLSGILGRILGNFKLLDASAQKYALRMMKVANTYDFNKAKIDEFNAHQKRYQQTQEKIDNLTQAGIVSSAVYAGSVKMLSAAFDTMGAAAPYQELLVHIQSVTEASDVMMEQLQNQAMKLGTTTKFSINQVTEGMDQLATMGKSATEILKMMPAVVGLATASMGKMSIEKAASGIAGVLNAFNMGADKASEVADKLTMATNLTSLAFNEFQTALSRTVATGAITDQTLDSILLQVGLMRNLSFTAERSSTAVTELNQSLFSSSKAVDALKKAGISTIDKDTGKLRSVIEMLNEYYGTLAGQDKQKKILAITEVLGIGKRAGMAAGSLEKMMITVKEGDKIITKHGVDAMEAFLQKMSNVSGVTDDLNARLKNTYTHLTKTIDNMIISFRTLSGEGMIEAFQPLIKMFNMLLTSVLDIYRKIPKETKAMIFKALFGTLAVTAVAGALGAIVSAFGVMSYAFTLMAVPFSTLAISAGGIVADMGAAGYAVSTFYAIWQRDIGGLASGSASSINRWRQMLIGTLQAIGNEGKLSAELTAELFTFDKQSGKLTANDGGVVDFIVRAYIAFEKFRHLITNMWDGFVDGLEDMEKQTGAFTKLKDLINALLEAFGITTKNFGNLGPYQQFAEIGELIGRTFALVTYAITTTADAVLLLVYAIKLASNYMEGMKNQFLTELLYSSELVKSLILVDKFMNGNLFAGNKDNAANKDKFAMQPIQRPMIPNGIRVEQMIRPIGSKIEPMSDETVIPKGFAVSQFSNKIEPTIISSISSMFSDLLKGNAEQSEGLSSVSLKARNDMQAMNGSQVTAKGDKTNVVVTVQNSIDGRSLISSVESIIREDGWLKGEA